MSILEQFRQYAMKPHVRPWALSAPILVLLICLPMLRPLRHPDPRSVSDDELARLATIQSLVEHRTLAIEQSSFTPTSNTVRVNGHTYSAQPPTLAVLLAGWYWAMHQFGLTFENNPSLVEYLLTMLGITIPVALGAGLIYRMSRMFELPRPLRGLMSMAVALGAGFVSYGVVINSHGPAAALLLGAAACIIHVAIAPQPGATTGWLAIAGMCAAFAAAIDPGAAIFLLVFACTIPAMRWRIPLKIGGLFLYALGAAPPLVLHSMLTIPITGDVFPPQLHAEFAAINSVATPAQTASPTPGDEFDDTTIAAGWWDRLGQNLARIAIAFFGAHGIFTHFPIVILGIFGVAAVMHRHWPLTTKTLATATIAGAVAIILVRCTVTRTGAGEMFGPQAFVLFLPLLLFWSGAWLRRHHHPVKYILAGSLLAFSAAVGVIGATDPFPRSGYDRYTVAQALSNLVRGNAVPQAPVLAGR